MEKLDKMLGNRLGVKSKTKPLIILLCKSVVYHTWNAARSFGLPASKKMLYKIEKGNKDDQELQLRLRGSYKRHGREKTVILHYSH